MDLDLEATLVAACEHIRVELDTLPAEIELYINHLEAPLPEETRVQVLEQLYSSGERIQKRLTQIRQSITPSHLDYVATVSLIHDLNSSVTILLGSTELWQENVSQNYLQYIKISAAQIQTWLHIDTEDDVPVRTLFTLVSDFSNDDLKEREITFEHSAGSDIVRVIPSFTTRRLYQTVRNAMKARTDPSAPYAITMHSHTEGDSCVVAIIDHGIGIYPSVIRKAAQTAGITSEQPTLYDTLCQIFQPSVSGFKEMCILGQGHGLNSASLAAQRGGQDVTLETTIYDPEGTLVTINKEHPNGYVDPTKTTTGTTFKYYLPLAKAP